MTSPPRTPGLLQSRCAGEDSRAKRKAPEDTGGVHVDIVRDLADIPVGY